MNEIVNNFLLAGGKFMPEMHSKQPEFTYSVCGPLTKNKETIQGFFSTWYGDFKDLKRRTACDKILRDKTFNIAKNPKYDGYQRGIASMIYEFVDKKSIGSGVNIPLEFNEQLTKKLHKPIIRKFEKQKFILDFKIIFGVLI